MVRHSTASLIVQLDHLWSLKRFMGMWSATPGSTTPGPATPGSVMTGSAGREADAVGRMALHLKAIEAATIGHAAIVGAVAEARDRCLRYVSDRQRGDQAVASRAAMLDALDRLQDRILAYPAVSYGRRP